MQLRNPTLVALLALAPAPASAAECGKWYSGACVCETDLRYCPDGENGASDDLKDQHPFWSDYEGFYSYTSSAFLFGLVPIYQIAGVFRGFPSYGFMNQTVRGSRTYNHRYSIMPPDPNGQNCTDANLTWFDGVNCVNGQSFVQEGFGTSTPERDGTVTTTLALQPSSGGNPEATTITDASAEYTLAPIDNNTLFGSAKSNLFFVAETFTFTNKKKTQGSAVQDVYMIVNQTSTLVQSTRLAFTRIKSAEAFEKAVLAAYEEHNVTQSSRAEFPPTGSCNQDPDECPTEEDFCEVDPRCPGSAAAVKYAEPDASVAAGPIVGIVVAAFVVLLCVLFYFHKKAMRDQAERNQATFARRIAETIKLEGPDRALTPEALAEEFKKIDSGDVDGTIDKKELWDFINSGKVAKMGESDFNALFAALDTDGDGTVSFMEFSAYMGKCYGDFDKLKGSQSVRATRGDRMDKFYSGVSTRILDMGVPAEKEEVEPMDKIQEEEKDEEN